MIMEWKIWQLIDATLPTGGFAHSYGLESAFQNKFVTNYGELMKFINALLYQEGNLSLPMLGSMFQVELETNTGKHATILHHWQYLDNRMSGMLTNHVAHRASIAQGKAFLRVVEHIYGQVSIYRSIFEELEPLKSQLSCHFAPCFALVTRILSLDQHTCQKMYLYNVLRDALSAANRLNLIGPLEAARLQQVFSATADRVVMERGNRTSVLDVYQSAPILDLMQGKHDQLYSRLFNS